jgi:hypothetical protein
MNGFFLVPVLCISEIAFAAMAYGQDESVQATRAALAAHAQEGSQTSGDGTDVQTPQAQAARPTQTNGQSTPPDAKNSEKKGEWLLAPIPIRSPAIGSGLEWAVARLFPFNKKDEVSPTSAVGVAGSLRITEAAGLQLAAGYISSRTASALPPRLLPR